MAMTSGFRALTWDVPLQRFMLLGGGRDLLGFCEQPLLSYLFTLKVCVCVCVSYVMAYRGQNSWELILSTM